MFRRRKNPWGFENLPKTIFGGPNTKNGFGIGTGCCTISSHTLTAVRDGFTCRRAVSLGGGRVTVRPIVPLFGPCLRAAVARALEAVPAQLRPRISRAHRASALSSRIPPGLVVRKEGGWHTPELAPVAWQMATDMMVMLERANSGSLRGLLRPFEWPRRLFCCCVDQISRPTTVLERDCDGTKLWRGSLEGGSPPVALMRAPWRQRSEARRHFSRPRVSSCPKSSSSWP